MYQLHNIDKQKFLAECWQKKPLVIRQGIINFIDPVDEHELAGLTEEESVDSRIISHSHNSWQVAHGPFKDINSHCVGAWSLLVQSVDYYIPEADQLMRAFDFIPQWRMDDLMVSYSNEQGGVGPHIDQYDVFIVQGKGIRRWQVGLPGNYKSVKPHPNLGQISGFEAVIDEVLYPGDIIYIPPNHPHNGTAQEPCLNYSVGFRAPSQQELLSSFADYAIDNNIFKQLYSDKNLTLRQFSGEIKLREIEQFKQLLQQMLENDQVSEWLPSFLSQSKETLASEQQEMSNYTHQEIVDLLKSGQAFLRAPGVKPVYIEQPLHTDQIFTFYIEGAEYSVPSNGANLVKNFLASPSITKGCENNYQNCLFFTQLLTTLVNSGHWEPE